MLYLPACLPTRSTPTSWLSLKAQKYSHLITFAQLGIDSLMNRVSAPGTPSIDWLQDLLKSPLQHGLHVHLQTRKITSSEWISVFTQSWHPTLSLNSPGCDLHVLTMMVYRSASPNSLNHGFAMHLNVHSIMSSKVNLETHFITASECISDFTHSHLQAHLTLLASTACSQSRYTMCRWVTI